VSRGGGHPDDGFVDHGGEKLTREELLAVSTRRRALAAWEARDESAFEAGQAAKRRDDALANLKMWAIEGCSHARRLLDERDLPENRATPSSTSSKATSANRVRANRRP
jgi:hypothetical protein